jgi:hypothetical protein
MKKEMIISVLVGLIFGLIIVYGVYTARTSLTAPDNSTNKLNSTPTPASDQNINEKLIIHNPLDEQVVDQKTIAVTGSTDPNSYIVVFINDNEYISSADDKGYFSIEGNLENGSNIIQIYALNEDGQSTVEERTVIYTTLPLVETTQPTASDSAKQ